MKQVRIAALNLLARREYSYAELRERLLAKGFFKEEIDSVLNKLIDEGLQSDARVAQAHIHARCFALYGPMRIEMELRGRGIADELMQHYLDNKAEMWFEILQKAWKKKYSMSPKDKKEYGRQCRFLLQRGFSAAMIHHFLKSSISESIDEYE